MRGKDVWSVAWLIISIGIFVAANEYTGSPMLDVTFGHVVIAGILGFIVTAVCFAVFVLARLAKSLIQPR